MEVVELVPGPMCFYRLQPYAMFFLERNQLKGSDSLGINAAGGLIVRVLLLLYWANREDDKGRNNAASRKPLVFCVC